MSITYAEVRIEGGDSGYYTKRYLVYNDDDDLIGSYGVDYSPRGAYAASRDFHKLVDDAEIARILAYKLWADNGYEGDSPPVGWGTDLRRCPYHDNKQSVCDGSSIVQITDNEQTAFEIAASMSER